LLRHSGDGWITQNARAVAGVDPCVYAFAALGIALFFWKSF
jgi:hypothetical protein